VTYGKKNRIKRIDDCRGEPPDKKEGGKKERRGKTKKKEKWLCSDKVATMGGKRRLKLTEESLLGRKREETFKGVTRNAFLNNTKKEDREKECRDRNAGSVWGGTVKLTKREGGTWCSSQGEI